MRKPIRILQVIGIMNRGGAETLIMNLYRNIDRTRVQFDFVVHTGADGMFDAEIIELGGTIYHCPKYVITNHFYYKRWWNNFLKEHSKDYVAVHGHIGSTASIYLSIAKKYGLYTIAHSHSAGKIISVKDIVYKVMSYNTRNVADYFFGCSELAGIKRYGIKVVANPKKFSVLNNAIEVNRFVFDKETRSKIRRELSIDDNQLVIGHIGRFDKAKNQTFLVSIFNEFQKNDKNAKLILVGTGENIEFIRTQISDLGIDNNVILTGVRSDAYDLLQAFDLFVFPSIYEGLPVTVIEAQAAGLKCLLSDTITNEVDITGLVEYMSLNSPAIEWAKKILDMIPYDRNDTSEKIKKAGYDIMTTAQQLTDFYLKIQEKK